jgi:predicted porin
MKYAMIRSVAAASALLFTAASHAQSSVTIYGTLDAGLLYQSKTNEGGPGNPNFGKNAGAYFGYGDGGYSPSIFGLKGVEDLGDGLKAKFQLESGINTGNGAFNSSNGNLWGRESWVGLDSDRYGEVRLGMQRSPFFETMLSLDPRQSLLGSALTPYLDNVVVTGLFVSNAVAYYSPVLDGFSGELMFGFGNTAGNFQAGRQWSARLMYQNRGLTAEAAYYDSNAGGSTVTLPTSDVPFEGRMIGAGYDFGRVSVKASVTNYKLGAPMDPLTTDDPDNYVFGGGASWSVLPDLIVNGAAFYQIDRNDTKSHALLGSLGAEYLLSKRTTLYTQVGLVHNAGGADVGIADGESGLIGTATVDGGYPTNPTQSSAFMPSGTSVAVDFGIRHMF